MNVLLTLLLVAAALAVILLAIPVAFAVQGGTGSSQGFRGRISLAGGLLACSFAARQGVLTLALSLSGITVWRGWVRQGRKEPAPAPGSPAPPVPRQKPGGRSIRAWWPGKGPRQEKPPADKVPVDPQIPSGKGPAGKKAGTRGAGRKKPAFSWQEAIELLRDRRLLATAIAFLRCLWRAFHLEVRLAGTYGTDDPALTGYLAALLATMDVDDIVCDLHPDFSCAILDISGSIRGHFIPAQLLALALTFMWQKPVRRLWLAKLKTKKSKLKESPVVA